MTRSAAAPSPPTLALPWHGRDVPHAVLDILRGCNVTCPGCYNAAHAHAKSLETVRQELNRLMELRKLHTVTISGGEPLLHPQLPEIVRCVRGQGLCVTVLTNGRLLDAGLASTLRRAGADAIFLHIQRGQVRADISGAAPPADWQALRAQKTGLVAAAGMTAGLAHVLRRDGWSEFMATLDEMLTSPDLAFMLVTSAMDFGHFQKVRGDVPNGLQAAPVPVAPALGPDMDEIRDTLAKRDLHPFAHVGSSSDSHCARWLAYLCASSRIGGHPAHHCITAARSDRLFLALAGCLLGRYPFLHRSGAAVWRVRLLCNALSGGRHATATLRLLAASMRPGHALGEKHIVLQKGPTLGGDGRVEICRDCPDATLVNGRLVPLCLADRMENDA